MWRAAVRGSSVALGAVLAMAIAYLLAAGVGAIVPSHPGWREAERGVIVFVRSNGIHTDIVMPARVGALDWLALIPPGHVRQPERARGWVAIGAGERAFFLETPRWRDFSLSTAAKAAYGGDILLHVEHLARPRTDADSRPLTLRPDEYRNLWKAIRAHFKPGAGGLPIPLPGRGYSDRDVFYEAVGRYDGVATCNEWTGRMLRKAGVNVGVWTPMPGALMWRLREV